MWRTSWCQNLTTIQIQERVRNFPSCREFSSLVWSGVAFDRRPTQRFFRVLRRVLQVIELQACHRLFAPSRRDQDRERIPVLPRLFAPLRWALPTVVAFLDLRRVSISSELESFLLSMCIDAPESTSNSCSSRDFEVGAGVAQASIGE